MRPQLLGINLFSLVIFLVRLGFFNFVWWINFIGKVYSFEKDSNRFKVLERRVKEYQATNISCHNQDFLELTSDSNTLTDQIDVIICDPSCSGSGMKLHKEES